MNDGSSLINERIEGMEGSQNTINEARIHVQLSRAKYPGHHVLTSDDKERAGFQSVLPFCGFLSSSRTGLLRNVFAQWATNILEIHPAANYRRLRSNAICCLPVERL